VEKLGAWTKSEGPSPPPPGTGLEPPLPGRRRTAWIDDVRRWTGDDMNVARTNAMERKYDCW